jgi:hypothetical protein
MRAVVPKLVVAARKAIHAVHPVRTLVVLKTKTIYRNLIINTSFVAQLNSKLRSSLLKKMILNRF